MKTLFLFFSSKKSQFIYFSILKKKKKEKHQISIASLDLNGRWPHFISEM